MDESGFDTLKATRALEAAGFESRKAEAMVTVFGGAVVGNVATKWDIRDLKGDMTTLQGDVVALKGDVAALQVDVAGLKDDVAGLKDDVAGLKSDVAALRTEFDAKLNQEIGALRTELKSEIGEVRLGVENLRATMYKLLLVQAGVIVSLILGLQRLL